MKVKVLGAEDVRSLLTPSACIELMHDTMVKLAEGATVQPLRTATTTFDASGVVAMMPAQVGNAFGYKAVTVFPSNAGGSVPTHQGIVALIDAATGSHIALVDGTSVTEIRTAAVSAVATRALARSDSTTLAIIGAGAQARAHVEALTEVLDLDEIRVWSRDSQRADDLIAAFAGQVGVRMIASSTAEDACVGADVVVTATSAATPVISRDWIADGTHINAVGSCIPTAREIDEQTIVDSIVVVDSIVSATNEAGDLMIPISQGLIGIDHIRAELGQMLRSGVTVRANEDQITLYESLGLGVQDLAAADLVYRSSIDSERGTYIEL